MIRPLNNMGVSMTTMRNKILWVTAACTVLSSTALYAKDDMVKSIMKLRADVESLYTKIDENKDAYKSQMKSYTMQITDNEAQINRLETSIKLAEQNIEKTQSEIKAVTSKGEDLKPLILSAIDSLVAEIKAGIPFKVDERIASVMKIKTDMTEGTITQEKAMALLWANYDDSIRLTKEIGLFKQEISLDGQTKLAKIAKIGSVMMFFSTPDDKVGYVTKKDGAYAYTVTEDEKEVGQIVKLFDSLQKQIRTGYFTLPNALILRGDK